MAETPALLNLALSRSVAFSHDVSFLVISSSMSTCLPLSRSSGEADRLTRGPALWAWPLVRRTEKKSEKIKAPTARVREALLSVCAARSQLSHAHPLLAPAE
jgi:hypothetical protein